MISDDTIAPAVATLVAAANPQQIVPFGSCARGDANADSDRNFMLVEREVTDRGKEMLRPSRALRPSRVPVDVLVVSTDELDRLGREAGSVRWCALKEGRVLHGRADDDRPDAGVGIARCGRLSGACRACGNHDTVLGCHALQAIEKAIKAVLSRRGLPVPRSHDIGQLLLTLDDAAIGPPPHAEWLDTPNPYAVAGRYGALDPGDLDRIITGTWLKDVPIWAQAFADPSHSGRPS